MPKPGLNYKPAHSYKTRFAFCAKFYSMRNVRITFITILTLLSVFSYSQTLTQVVRGSVSDELSKNPGSFATVRIPALPTVPAVVADSAGNFTLSAVPVGRHAIEVSATGFQTQIISEVVVSSGKETYLQVYLKENALALEGVILKPQVNKSKPLNNMAVASARMLSVEEANRYAGGFDDYARLAASFPGVASNVGNNGIMIRGNAPRLIQWKMEGVEIPNPNHFADLSSFGGGGLTGLSSQLLSNSDFLTGAFPAEYSNALSGVFDMNMRKGNNKKTETTLQLGLIGIDAAIEGPLKKGKQSSYLFNYRYSTLGLLSSFMPDDAAGTNYQDLSFKLHFPTRKAGTFSIWGVGLIDRSGQEAETDPAKWSYLQDKERQDVKQYTGSAGLTHQYFLNKKSYLKTTLAATTNSIDLVTDRMNNAINLLPQNKITNKTSNLVFSTFVNTKFNSRHTNKTGITFTGMKYNLFLAEAPQSGLPLETIVSEKGSGNLVNAYTSSSFRISDKLMVNAGLSSQYFSLNGRSTIEPRLGIKYQLNQSHTVAFAYGMHSRLERLNYYFTKSAETPDNKQNRRLDFTKANHFVLSYDWTISKNMHLKIEPYVQLLYDVPVIRDSSYSFINLENDWFLDKQLVNEGKGRNIGIDITLEKYLTNGFYYLVSTSVFDSKYMGGDKIWRSTRFNRNFLFNGLAGKEWQMGRQKKNVLGLNLKLSYQGGDHYTPADLARSVADEDVVFDGTRAFEKSLDPSFFTHLTFNFRKNKKRSSHEWSLKLNNATGQKEFYGFRYNLKTQGVDMNRESLIVPNLSYKIQF